MEQTSRTKRGYRGGKAGAGVYQKLINLMPPHTVYIEPFLGHGAILLHKRPARLSIGLDLDARAVQEVRARVRYRQREHVCSVDVPDCGAGLDDVPDYDAGTHDACDDNAGLPHASDDVAGTHDASDDDRGRDIEVGPARYRLLVADALDFLRSYPFTGNELLYADPPYVRSTRRTRGRLYRYELDDHQHGELLALLRRLPCAVMVSGYRSALYEQTLEDWRTITYQAQTRGGPATEVVWMNYEERPARHEYTYQGDNFHAREQITRVQGRWVQKLLPKPETEQAALLLAQLTRVGPTVRDAVLMSALTQYGDEDLTVSKGVSGSHPWQGNGAAAQSAPTMLRASRCTICRHAARQRIDQALAAGASVREVAQREGLSKSVLGRHRAHAPEHAVSHFESGTADQLHQQKPTPRSVQLELLALDTLG